MERLSRLQETLYAEIPITRAIGLCAEGYANGCLMLSAPLKPNINHKDTAFAGSINAVATLAGWSLLWLVLDEASLSGKVVIQDSRIQYLRPITGDFGARCCLPAPERVAQFLTVLRRRKRARIELEAEIWEAQMPAVKFAGRYVVQGMSD